MMRKNYVQFGEDPEGFFHIYIDSTRRYIVAEHYHNVVKDASGRELTVSGRMNKAFRGSNAETLYRTILGNIKIGRMDHAAYLGYELGKAETALKNNIRYEQDRPVKV
jgi:tetrahydromethanopterin S-methyltransferase subunit A